MAVHATFPKGLRIHKTAPYRDGTDQPRLRERWKTRHRLHNETWDTKTLVYGRQQVDGSWLYEVAWGSLLQGGCATYNSFERAITVATSEEPLDEAVRQTLLLAMGADAEAPSHQPNRRQGLQALSIQATRG